MRIVSKNRVRSYIDTALRLSNCSLLTPDIAAVSLEECDTATARFCMCEYVKELSRDQDQPVIDVKERPNSSLILRTAEKKTILTPTVHIY